MSSDGGFLGWRRPRPLTRARLATTLTVCLLATVVIVLVAPLLGVTMTPSGRAFEVMSPSAVTDAGSIDHAILVGQRLPRVLSALVIGAALAAAGCALQALLRNPLAEPFTLGVSSGSSLAAVIAIRLGLGGALAGMGVSVAALLGAAGVVLLVWRLARVGDRLPAATLLLAGVTMAMFCSAASMLVQYTADFAEVSRMLRWMMGGLETMRYAPLWRATVPIAVGLAVLWWHARDLNAMAAGPEAAASVGVSVGRVQRVVFAVASLLVGAAIALGGPIGFVGLMVPHALRALLGPDHRVLLPASMLVGGALLVVCDTLARLVIAPAQLPVGVVTALIGGPFFVGILLAGKRRAWSAG
ncbi:MAG: iron ABC transporter permease [Kofleriaceae bacterium]